MLKLAFRSFNLSTLSILNLLNQHFSLEMELQVVSSGKLYLRLVLLPLPTYVKISIPQLQSLYSSYVESTKLSYHIGDGVPIALLSLFLQKDLMRTKDTLYRLAANMSQLPDR